MPQKQAKMETKVEKVNNFTLKNKVFNVVLAVLVIAAACFTAWKINKKVEKDVINNYICQIVQADDESGLMGMRCMVREP